MRHVLDPHPRSRCDAVARLEAEVTSEPRAVTLTYLLTGDIGRLVIPAPTTSARVDDLWRHTCFEAFVAMAGEGYAEFNFAPSGQWAAYRFDGYRRGMAALEMTPPGIEATATADTLSVRVTLALPARQGRLGLSAVIEEVGGGVSYWALRHPSGQPDFHHPDGFVLTL